ncbi:MAG TPA: hypothetical protein PKL31_17640 [Fulvivirga sp.]|nr:hypothetical protein [Fulvivirga sp.]
MKILKLSLTCFFIFILGSTFAQSDFRNIDWGADKSTVKEAEKNKLVSEDAIKIVYECSLDDIKGKLFYIFTSTDQLWRGKYYLTPDYYNMHFYIADYKMLHELLTQKYGAPVSSFAVPNKQTIQENEWAAHLAAGNLRLESNWTTPTMDVQLILSKLSESPAIQIDYISKEFREVEIKIRKAKIITELK